MDAWLFILLFIFFDVALLVFVLMRKKGGFSREERQKYQRYYQQIKAEKDKKHAVLEADKLLDILLKHKGYHGSLGEKLKASGVLFSQLDQVWRAHKLRNRLAHELQFHPSDSELQDALHAFLVGYKDLGLFD